MYFSLQHLLLMAAEMVKVLRLTTFFFPYSKHPESQAEWIGSLHSAKVKYESPHRAAEQIAMNDWKKLNCSTEKAHLLSAGSKMS